MNFGLITININFQLYLSVEIPPQQGLIIRRVLEKAKNAMSEVFIKVDTHYINLENTFSSATFQMSGIDKIKLITQEQQHFQDKCKCEEEIQVVHFLRRLQWLATPKRPHTSFFSVSWFGRHQLVVIKHRDFCPP